MFADTLQESSSADADADGAAARLSTIDG